MTQPDPLAAVRQAQDRLADADLALRDAVTAAREHGHTWAELGTALGVSRQAAFKRFGTPKDPRTGDPMTATPTTDLVELTERVFTLVDRGEYPLVQELMTPETAKALTRDLVLDTWASVVADHGNLVGCRGTRLELPDGSTVPAGEPVLGVVIGHTSLECDAGTLVGRVAFDGDRRVVGLLVVPEGTTDLPF